MDKDKTAVKIEQPAAPVTEVIVPAASQEDSDAEKEYKALMVETLALETAKAKSDADRDNYKKGLLKAKGKLPEEEEESVSEIVAREVAKALASSKEVQIRTQQDALIQKVLKENKELRTTVGNKAGMSSAGIGSGGTGGNADTVSKDYWTPEQVAYFKKRGIDPEKVKANISKAPKK